MMTVIIMMTTMEIIVDMRMIVNSDDHCHSELVMIIVISFVMTIEY